MRRHGWEENSILVSKVKVPLAIARCRSLERYGNGGCCSLFRGVTSWNIRAFSLTIHEETNDYVAKGWISSIA